MPLRGRLLAVFLTLLGTLTLSGCFGKGVEIEVHNVPDNNTVEKITQWCKENVDSRSSHSISHTYGTGQPLVIKLKPVADPEAFAKKIKFGTVEKVDGTKITVRYTGL